MSTEKIYTHEEFEELIRYSVDPETGAVTSKLVKGCKVGDFSCRAFNKQSIFDDEAAGTVKRDREFVEEVLRNPSEALAGKRIGHLEDGAMGALVGMAVADAMGHRYEFQPVVYDTVKLRGMGEGPGGAFQLQPGQWTDDASMGLCLADSLLTHGGELDGHDLMHRFLAWWSGGYDNAFRYDPGPRSSVGLGGNISLSFAAYIRKPAAHTPAGDKNTSGNGSVMRNAPVAVCYHADMDAALRVAAEQSLTTHQGTEAAECCRLLTHITVKGLNGERLADVLAGLGDTFQTDVESVRALARSEAEHSADGSACPDRDWRWRSQTYHYCKSRARANPGYIGSYAMDAMAMALHVLHTTDSFEAAVVKVVNMRGDSDSVGSVVAQMAGAFYGLSGIPKAWVDTLAQWDHHEIALRGYMLAHIRDGSSSYAEPKHQEAKEDKKEEEKEEREEEKEEEAK